MDAAERLLHDIDPAKAYPFDFIIFRITGYRPKNVNPDLLTGLALQHDIGLLIEQVSQTLDFRTHLLAEPILTIEDVSEKFNVTSKTIQRWRRRGLPARRFIFPDGRRRVGFLLGSVERFFQTHRDQFAGAGNAWPVSDSQQDEMIRRARRMAVQGRCDVQEIVGRLGKRMNRSPLAILHLIRKHDQENPDDAVLPLASERITDEDRGRILRGHRRGMKIRSLARRFGRSRASVYRVILDDRVARLGRRKMRFVDDPLYHQTDAAEVMATIVSQQEMTGDRPAEERRIPRDLPPYLQELYRTPLLSPARERAMFLKFNFHKFQFVSARRKLDPQRARGRDADRLEAIEQQVIESKNAIVRANLRLVVSVARRHLRPGLSLMELISDGNLTLMRAVESFDIHRGHRFSTYATLALMKGFARGVPLMLAGRFMSMEEGMAGDIPDSRLAPPTERLICREEVSQLLSHLNERERAVLLAHYGLDHSIPATHEQVGLRLGLSKQRIRQIERSAIEKLRSLAGQL